jgi:PAS domain S-box-containing protein
VSQDAAKTQALNQLRRLRYGRDNRDYFWVCDYTPVLLMHPYRTDLEGQDVSDYADTEGTRVFQEMVDLVKDQGGGYLSYLWQLHGDPSRIQPKRSYVRGFAPWRWIVGTGLYVEEASAEVRRLARSVAVAAVGSFALVGLAVFGLAARSMWLLRSSQHSAERLRRVEEEYEELVESMTDGLIAVDPQETITYANRAFGSIVGVDRHDLIGRQLTDFLAETDNDVLLRQLAERRRDVNNPYELTLLQSDGTPVPCVISPRARFGETGVFTGSFAVVTDVSDLKAMEKELRLSLREIHHRVKNNLQVVSSMLHLQQELVADHTAKAALQDSQHRVETMALVHSFLYSSGRVTSVRLDEYVSELVATLSSAYSAVSRGIAMDVDVDPAEIHIDQAVTLALIVTEAVTNALKHAFPDSRPGSIRVEFTEADDPAVLTIRDNGIGIDRTSQTSTSLGFTLMNALAGQLRGTLEILSDAGTAIVVTVPKHVGSA